ncbi:MAG: hypothetical protein V4712_13680 [Pseudomonadota bacterium]
MSFRPQHELHRRRFGRNLGVGLVLVSFVVLVFALTVVKVTRGEPMKGYGAGDGFSMAPAAADAAAAPKAPGVQP